MNQQISISIREWLPSDSADPIEKATSAELEIIVGDFCATQVEDFDSKTVRSTIRVSAEPIAKWLLANWWRLRWEAEPLAVHENLSWAMSHSLASIGNGFIWPDLVFKGSDGKAMNIECKRHISQNWAEFSPIRFLNSFTTTVSAESLETAVRSFVDTVISRLDSFNIRDSELHDLHKDLNKEWHSPKLGSFRRLEALLALEPDENEPLVSSLLKTWSKQFGRSAIEEISAASNSANILEILANAKATSKGVKTYADIPSAGGVVQSWNDQQTKGVQPWQSAQSLAYALRKDWDLGFSSISDSQIAARLSLSESKVKETKPNSLLAFGYRGEGPGKLGIVLNRSHAHGRRFDLVRLIGDYITLESKDRMMPATSSMTARQKFQRAFAAEFLCPSKTLLDRFPDGIDQPSIATVVDDVSSEFNVAEQVVVHHLENRKLISSGFSEANLLFA